MSKAVSHNIREDRTTWKAPHTAKEGSLVNTGVEGSQTEDVRQTGVRV